MIEGPAWGASQAPAALRSLAAADDEVGAKAADCAAITGSDAMVGTLSAAARKAPIFAAELGAGPLVGLDRPLRGGELSAALLLDLGGALGPGFSGLMQGIEAAALYDISFQATILCADIVFYLGPELRLLAGCEMPLGSAALDADGVSLALNPGSWPNRFAVSVLLGRLGCGPETPQAAPLAVSPAASAAQSLGRGPRFSIEAEFGWSSYRLADQASATRLQTAQSGIRGFSAGFRLGTVLRLRWGAFP
jgi:hypothetical protein